MWNEDGNVSGSEYNEWLGEKWIIKFMGVGNEWLGEKWIISKFLAAK